MRNHKSNAASKYDHNEALRRHHYGKIQPMDDPHPLTGARWLVLGPVFGLFAAIAVVLVLK